VLRASLARLVEDLRACDAWQRKHEIEVIRERMVTAGSWGAGHDVRIGDDAAAIPSDDGYLLLAAEAVYPPLVAADPRLAGRVSILANVNDIYAMGGYPIAVVDTVVADGTEVSGAVIQGMLEACNRYDVALVGGHLTANHDAHAVSVAILGRARRLLSGFDAKTGELLVHVTGLDGSFHPEFRFWNCSAHLRDDELRGQLAVLPTIAEAGWCGAARDVSMGGLLGSALMLLDLSGVGAVIDLEAIAVPEPAANRWFDRLLAVPSYGFVLSVPSSNWNQVRDAFRDKDLSCEAIGTVTSGPRVVVRRGGEEAVLWDFSHESFTGLTQTQMGN
jgi:AIR synthase-related protein